MRARVLALPCPLPEKNLERKLGELFPPAGCVGNSEKKAFQDSFSEESGAITLPLEAVRARKKRGVLRHCPGRFAFRPTLDVELSSLSDLRLSVGRKRPCETFFLSKGRN
jgi:hypothetical protein